MNPLNHQYAAASPPERLEMDAFTKSFTHLSNSSSSSLDFSFDRLVESSPSDEAQCEMIEQAIRIGGVLVEAGLRATRKRDAEHNSRVWPLNSDLTVNVFFWLDTRSVCYAAATCNFFRRCTTDPLCYARINLLTAVPKVDNLVVSTMIQRAGKALRSIKLGLLPASSASLGPSQPPVYSQRNSTNGSGLSRNVKRSRQRKESCILTRSCLNSLIIDDGASGYEFDFSPNWDILLDTRATCSLLLFHCLMVFSFILILRARLRCLHLYYIERMDGAVLSEVLSACPTLLDLVFVGLHVELSQTFESVSQHCHILERLYIESPKTGRDDSLNVGRYDSLQISTCLALVQNCPRIISFALRGFELQDHIILCLIKGFRYLTSLDFSASYAFTGGFLRKLGGSAGGNLLEFMFLCDCMHLKKEEVKNFLSAVLAGDFKLLRHLDISNWDGLATEDGRSRRCCTTSFIPLNQLCEARPNFSIRAEFPSLMEVESDEDVSSDTSDVSLSMNSGVSSGSEDSRNTSYVSYEESLDDSDFLSH